MNDLVNDIENTLKRKAYCGTVLGAAYCSVMGKPAHEQGGDFAVRLSALSTFALLTWHDERDHKLYKAIDRIVMCDPDQSARVARMLYRIYMAKEAAYNA